MQAIPSVDEGKAYTSWNIQFPLLDGRNNVIESITAVQELYIGSDEFIVRVTRDMHGTPAKYEDRGTIDAAGRISGKSGFGGRLTGQIFRDSFGVLLQATEGDAEFILGAIRVTATHNRCFRQFDVRKSTTIFGTKVGPGRYFTTSNDYLAGSADRKPMELETALAI